MTSDDGSLGLDPHYEWEELRAFDGTCTWLRGPCRHLDVVPVQVISGEVVAHLCLGCDAQLP